MTRVPFAIGEEFSSKWAFAPFVEQGLLNYARLDVSNVGGLTEAQKGRRLVRGALHRRHAAQPARPGDAPRPRSTSRRRYRTSPSSSISTGWPRPTRPIFSRDVRARRRQLPAANGARPRRRVRPRRRPPTTPTNPGRLPTGIVATVATPTGDENFLKLVVLWLWHLEEENHVR